MKSLSTESSFLKHLKQPYQGLQRDLRVPAWYDCPVLGAEALHTIRVEHQVSQNGIYILVSYMPRACLDLGVVAQSIQSLFKLFAEWNIFKCTSVIPR